MPRFKRARHDDDGNGDEHNDYDSDGGFVEKDVDAERSSKRSKISKTKKAVPSASAGEGEFWALSSTKNPKRVAVSNFKGNNYVNIREYYEADGEYKPGKKGISLSVEQYNNLLKAIPTINAKLVELGEKVEGSTYGEQSEEDHEAPSIERVRAKPQKSNIDATSDEDED